MVNHCQFTYSVCFNVAGVIISSSMMDPKSEEKTILQERESVTSTLRRSELHRT